MFKSKYLFIDKIGSRYKKVIKLLGFNVGEWKVLPRTNYLAITKVRFSKTVNSPKLMGNKSCTSNFSDYKYCLFFCTDAQKKKLAYKGNRPEVMKLAEEVAKYLEIEVVDYTNSKP